MPVEDGKSNGKGGFGSVDRSKHHLVAAHGASGIPVSALSNTRKTNDIGICQTCNVRFEDLQDLYDHLDGCIWEAEDRSRNEESI